MNPRPPVRRPLAAALLLCASLCASFGGLASGEIVALKDGRILEGDILEVTEEKVSLRIQGADMAIPLSSVSPEHVYRLRSKRLDPKDARGHFALGEFCLANSLVTQGIRLLEKAVELEPARKEAADRAIAAAVAKDATELLEAGRALLQDSKYDEALRRLQVLLEKYPQSAQAGEAKKVMTDATEGIKKRNEEREKQLAALEKKKADDKAAKGEDAIKARFDLAGRLVEEAKKLHVEGLDHEGNTRVTRAHQTWERGVARLLEARAALVDVQAQTKVDELKSAGKDKVSEVDRWLVIIYSSLGHLWAMELNFRDSIKWLNKALAIDPQDKIASELKLKVAEQQIQRRSFIGGGGVVVPPAGGGGGR